MAKSFDTKNFKGWVSHENGLLKIEIVFRTRSFKTYGRPELVQYVLSRVPSLLTCRCINEKHLEFSDEIWNTEFGHLFEHILLEYISQIKADLHHIYEKVSGTTSWNWTKTPRGHFIIEIRPGFVTDAILSEALNKTINLFDKGVIASNLTNKAAADLSATA